MPVREAFEPRATEPGCTGLPAGRRIASQVLMVLGLCMWQAGHIAAQNATTGAATKPGSPHVELSKPADRVAVRILEKQTVLDVISASGIGQMTLRSEPGEWPESLVIRLRTPEGMIRGLEGFQVTTTAFQVRGRSAQSGKLPFFLADATGGYERDDRTPSGWMNITFEQTPSGLEIRLPRQFGQSEGQIQIQWIDFYR